MEGPAQQPSPESRPPFTRGSVTTGISQHPCDLQMVHILLSSVQASLHCFLGNLCHRGVITKGHK